MARQVVSYSDLEALPPVQQGDTRDVTIGSAQFTAETCTGRGGTAILESTDTAHLTSVGAGTIAAQVEDNKAEAVGSPPPKKRKLEDANSSADVDKLVTAEVHDQQLRTQLQTQADAKGNAGKKRKKQGKQRKKQQWKSKGETGSKGPSAGSSSVSLQHWDDPGAEINGLAYDYGEAMSSELMDGTMQNTEDYFDEQSYEMGGYDDDISRYAVDYGEDEDESRELTQEEVWDDSALIAAYDAATEEYEAMHGKEKLWKKERVHKSALWYNVPPELESKGEQNQKAKVDLQNRPVSNDQDPHARPQPSGAAAAVDHGSAASHDYNTFVPTHDASLSTRARLPSLPEPTKTHLSNVVSYYAEAGGDADDSAHANISGVDHMDADYAFSRATDAMYWCGYWTAVYHIRRSQEHGATGASAAPDANEDGQEVEDEEAILVSTQR